MEDETLLDHVADIVSAHVSNNSVSASDLPGLIQSVHAALAGLGQAPEPVEEKLTPAVSIRSSVKPDSVTCLECGARMKMLKRHLGTDHGLSPADYRARWNLPADYPMVAPAYATKRRELALTIGLGRKPGQKPKAAAKTKSRPAKPGSAEPAPAAAAPAKPARSRKKLGVAFGLDSRSEAAVPASSPGAAPSAEQTPVVDATTVAAPE